MSSVRKNSLKLTPRGRHALMALIELSRMNKDAPVPLSKLALAGQISLSYLEQLFTGLRRHGLVKSYRGPGGGYVLAKTPKEIYIADILLSAEDCAPARRKNVNDENTDSVGNAQASALWSHIGDVLHVYLGKITLEDVANDNLDDHPVTNKLFETLG